MESAVAVIDARTDIEGLYRADGDRLWRAIFAFAGDPEIASDGQSVFPRWTSDGRIVYSHVGSNPDPAYFELWIMDAEGGNKTRIADTDVAAMTALGCTICPFTLGGQTGLGYWQPQP